MKIIKRIESRENKIYRDFQKILEPNGIKKKGQFFLSGKKIISESIAILRHLKKEGSRILAWVMTERQLKEWDQDLDASVPGYLLSNSLFSQLDIMGTGYPLLLIQEKIMESWDGELSPHGLDLFLPFQDPGNLGSAIRSAAAFGARKIILLKEATTPCHPKSLRASGPALFLLDFFYGPSLGELLAKAKTLPLAVLDKGGQDIRNIGGKRQLGLVLGIEGPGITRMPDKDWLSKNISSYGISISDGVESLNASSALAIALYEFNRGSGRKAF